MELMVETHPVKHQIACYSNVNLLLEDLNLPKTSYVKDLKYSN